MDTVDDTGAVGDQWGLDEIQEGAAFVGWIRQARVAIAHFDQLKPARPGHAVEFEIEAGAGTHQAHAFDREALHPAVVEITERHVIIRGDEANRRASRRGRAWERESGRAKQQIAAEPAARGRSEKGGHAYFSFLEI